ncbi:MAG TPA: phytoene desaturase [Ktedonobacterales bacterium]|nr:phytoene desaturase [Ktedonobacterales bacterium]
MRIVVIGSGFGGLAAAIRLQAQGHQVTLVERRDKPGGRAYVFEQDGFTFDAGPTILTAPWLLDELFAAAGKRLADYVSLVALDPCYNVRFDDGSVFHYTADRQRMLAEIRRFNPADEAGYLRFLAKAEQIYAAGMALIDRPFTHAADMLRVAPDLLRLRAYRSVAGLAGHYLRDERLRQVFSFHPLLIGGHPFRATAIYALVHPLEMKGGVLFARGGTGVFVAALARVFGELGGTLLLNSEAHAILVDEATHRASGVRLAGGETLPAEAVVSNADIATTYLRLIPARIRRHNTDRRVRHRRYSMSLVVIYFGTDRQYPQMAHHEILMGPRYRGLLDDIFTRKTLASDFSLYLHRPTATDPSLAPAGCDCWYVLSPVPHLGAAIDWASAARPYRDAIIRSLEERYLPDLSRHIVTERMIDPRYFRDELGSHLGSAFSVEPILTQSAWFRPHNVSEDVPNLYFCGAGTHPGAGVPGVLSSGKIVADLIGPADPSRTTCRSVAR